ncbi:MAG: hypothetical protein K2P78_02550 [Gemmataceae bacterium]|nr:hypothetical protein [Gemmataceae bacterium]
MPDWFINILTQFPIVAVLGFVAWYAYREVRVRDEEQRRNDRERHAAEVANLKEAHEQLVSAKNEEIARLAKELRDEVRRLGRIVGEWNERMKS